MSLRHQIRSPACPRQPWLPVSSSPNHAPISSPSIQLVSTQTVINAYHASVLLSLNKSWLHIKPHALSCNTVPCMCVHASIFLQS
uniref:Uncharacterized protein n=1 Tax=Arundo donax TaxID=35708 RepID=A0A0A9HNL7_ARUDO